MKSFIKYIVPLLGFVFVVFQITNAPTTIRYHDKTTTTTTTTSINEFKQNQRRPTKHLFRGYYKAENECRILARQLRDIAAKQKIRNACNGDEKKSSDTRTTSSVCLPMLVHTELLMKRSPHIDTRQEQLPILSFLMTQDASLTLNILVNEADRKEPPDWLSKLLSHPIYGQRLRLDYWKDFNSLDLSKDEISSLQTAYTNVTTLANKSDLRRYVVLYYYGGIWFDTDTLFLNDIRPLLGIDFVYVAGTRYNGAVLGASQSKSKFIHTLITYSIDEFLSSKNENNYYRFADVLFKNVYKQRHKDDEFMLLSGCLFDQPWGGKFQYGLPNNNIFTKPMKEEYNLFLNDPTGPFSFHWHGKWGTNIESNSVAAVLHAQYIKELQLDPADFIQ